MPSSTSLIARSLMEGDVMLLLWLAICEFYLYHKHFTLLQFNCSKSFGGWCKASMILLYDYLLSFYHKHFWFLQTTTNQAKLSARCFSRKCSSSTSSGAQTESLNPLHQWAHGIQIWVALTTFFLQIYSPAPSVNCPALAHACIPF